MRLRGLLGGRRREVSTGGAEARERAEHELRRTRAQTERYADLARDLRQVRENNHLAEAFLRSTRRATE